MTTEIQIGSTVKFYSDEINGEQILREGELLIMNQRYARVLVDGLEMLIGKSKIKLVKEPDPIVPKFVAGSDYYRKAAPETNNIPPRTTCVKIPPGGSIAADCGDQTANLMRGKSLDEVYDLASHYLNQTPIQLKLQYKHLNNGQQRMCLGNRVRRVLRGKK